jgi:hypothetical protein
MSHIVVDQCGTIKFIYEDDLRSLLQAGHTQVKRVSHVEPTSEGRWTADLSPINGPVLGPFELRNEALNAEIKYLTDHVL